MIFYNRELLELIDKAKKGATEKGFSFREPSPLLSIFWRTNFTPSSFEIAVKEIKDNPTQKEEIRIFSIQPCVRVSDITPRFDGIHLASFNMFTFFILNCKDIESEVSWFLNFLNQLGSPLSKAYFSYYLHKYDELVPEPKFKNFGLDLLKTLNIQEERCIACPGLDNYQITYNYDCDNEQQILTEGPRIEIFIYNKRLIEFATLVYSKSSWLDKSGKRINESGPLLAMVFGIERLYQAIKLFDSFSEVDYFIEIRNKIIYKTGLSSLYSENIDDLINLFMGLIAISAKTPNSFKPGGKGANDELRKLVRMTINMLNHVGIYEDIILDVIEQYISSPKESILKIKDWFKSQRNLMKQIKPSEK
jgi:alanyl-tRNA synthetase